MNYFSPGMREMVRIAQRANNRTRLIFTRRALAKAETQLGLLGWQQADFDKETQRQVDALQNIEREQARLNNRSAELARELKTLADKRAEARGSYEQQRTALESDRAATRQPLADLEHRLNLTQSALADAERQIDRLDKERRDIEALSNKLLLVYPQPPDTRKELLRLRDRILTIENEQKDLKSSHARGLSEAQQIKQQIEAIENRSAEVERRLQEMRDAFQDVDDGIALEEQQRTREKEKAEDESNRLERAKSDPYREIGRVLADHMIAPMNQPLSLDKVLRLREQVHDIKAAIAALLQASRSANQYELRISLSLWGAIFLTLALTIAALL